VRRAVILGTGLIGTSIALALAEKGVDVLLDDPDSGSLALAVDLGAGRRLATDAAEAPADIAVLAAPPAVTEGTGTLSAIARVSAMSKPCRNDPIPSRSERTRICSLPPRVSARFTAAT
jgi:prephenate dehydrogenase